MNVKTTKKAIIGAGLTLMLLFSVGMTTGTTAQAQDRNRSHNWDRRDRDGDRDGRWDGRRRWDRDNRGRWGRDNDWRRRNNSRFGRVSPYRFPRVYPRVYNPPVYRAPRVIPYGGGYGYGGYGYGGAYGYNNSELQRGYRNGLKEGGDDARDRDSFNPSRHSSFRDGNPSYREGFARGYQEGYRQYSGYGRW